MPLYSPTSDIPVGTITPFGASSAPSTKWLICDGSAVSRTTYSALFSILSTTYGTGDGTTTFNLPDLRGRHTVGQGTHTDVDTLGESDGLVVADRRPKHKHTVNDPGHAHANSKGRNIGDAQGGAGGVSPLQVNDQPTSSTTTGITIGPQTNVATDSPAYLVVQYIIRALA